MHRPLRPLLLVALVVGPLSAPAAADVPISTIDSLALTRSGNTITADGIATMGNASDATVGTDVTGDARIYPLVGDPISLTGLGMDLTSARIKHDSAGNRLLFTLGIADPIDQTFTVPELVAYHWLIKVTNGDTSIYYQLQAMRSGQYERTLPSAEPRFLVNSCGSLASGTPNCFELAGYVDGVMANGIVQWNVPVALIGAFDGATIEQSAPGQVRSLFSASGAAYFGTHGDSIETIPYVVGPAVHIGMRKSTQDPSLVLYQTPAALGPDGSFVGKIAVPMTPGTWVVSARACHGDSRGCALRDAQIVI
ncbi:MAG: hypothetical protein ACRDHM_00940 [Actinomycetota bacterium]